MPVFFWHKYIVSSIHSTNIYRVLTMCQQLFNCFRQQRHTVKKKKEKPHNNPCLHRIGAGGCGVEGRKQGMTESKWEKEKIVKYIL